MIVIDASVAAKWILDEEFSLLARQLYAAMIDRDQLIIAPPLLLGEMTNIIRQRMRRPPPITREEALGLLDAFQAFQCEIRNPRELHHEALSIADEFGLAAAYDAHYLALARITGSEFWTNDRRLIRQVSDRLTFVRWIGDFQGPVEPLMVD